MEKSSDAEKDYNRMREFASKPGFQFSYRHALRTVYALKELEKEEKTQKDTILNSFGEEAGFLSVFSISYPFYRFVRRSEMHRRKDWYSNQLKELGYLILLDLFHPEKATPSEAEKKTNKAKNDELVPIQNFSRIRSNNPEVFFAPTKLPVAGSKGRKRHQDKRLSYFSTVFSELPKAEELDHETVCLLELALTAAVNSTFTPEESDQMKELMVGLRMVDPDDILGLETFWQVTKHSIKIMTENYGQPTQNAWLIPHVKKGSSVVEGIYQLVDTAIALRWYRTIKSERRRKNLHKERHPLRYPREDAKVAVGANLRWFNDPVQVTDLVFRGAAAYSHIGELNIALSLYEECLRQVPMDSQDLGLCYHNMGIAYRDFGKPKKYLGCLMKALHTFESVGDFDVGITWAHIAEAYHLLGDQRKREAAKVKSKEILLRPSLSKYRQSQAFLLVADCAAFTNDGPWEKEALKLGFDASVAADNLDLAAYYIQRQSDLEHGRNTLLAEREPGKLKRPLRFNGLRNHRIMLQSVRGREVSARTKITAIQQASLNDCCAQTPPVVLQQWSDSNSCARKPNWLSLLTLRQSSKKQK